MHPRSPPPDPDLPGGIGDQRNTGRKSCPTARRTTSHTNTAAEASADRALHLLAVLLSQPGPWLMRKAICDSIMSFGTRSFFAAPAWPVKLKPPNRGQKAGISGMGTSCSSTLRTPGTFSAATRAA
jgi:hypothetical protein